MWIYIPSVSVPVEEDSKSASSWPFPALAWYAGLNGKPSAKESWFRVWKRASWMKRLCGVISEPSTAEAGAARWISSLRDTRANHSARPVDNVAKTILDTCGPTFIELSKRFILPSSFWKTSQGTLSLGLEGSCEISKHQATELRRLSSQRRKWARATNGSGCLSSGWITPWVLNLKGSKKRLGQGSNESIQSQAEQWQTPHGMSNEDENGKVGGCGGGEFAKQANNWPTARGRDAANAANTTARRKPNHGYHDGDTLVDAIRKFRSFPQAPTKPSDGPKSSQSGPNSRRRLNPVFVNWLMNWPPLEGDGFEPSETAWSRYRRRMRSAYLRLVCSENEHV